MSQLAMVLSKRPPRSPNDTLKMVFRNPPYSRASATKSRRRRNHFPPCARRRRTWPNLKEENGFFFIKNWISGGNVERTMELLQYQYDTMTFVRECNPLNLSLIQNARPYSGFSFLKLIPHQYLLEKLPPFILILLEQDQKLPVRPTLTNLAPPDHIIYNSYIVRIEEE